MSVQGLLRGVSKSRSVGRFLFREHGTVVRTFAPLLLRFGARAEKELMLCERAFLRCFASGSEVSFRMADAAATRLRKMIKRLPAREQDHCTIELERRMQTLNSKRDGFGRLLAQAAESAAVKMSSGRRKKKNNLAEKILSVFGELMDAAAKRDRPVFAIWRHFRKVVSPSSSSVRSALDYLAAHQAEIKDAARVRNLQALWGYLAKIRGELGEGYALLNKVWKGVVDSRIQEAERIASKLGPGHEVHYLTQLDNAIKVNELEGPDALIVIINRKTKQAFFHTAAQVKTARTSEGVGQSVNDLLRSAGEQRYTLVPTCEFTLNGKREIFTLGGHPLVETNRYIINATGSRIPSGDLYVLQSLSHAVTEFELDMTVDQFTLLAISLLEAALKAY